MKTANGGGDTKMTAKDRGTLAKYRLSSYQGVSLIAGLTAMTGATMIGGMRTGATTAMTVGIAKVATVDGITMMVGTVAAVRGMRKGKVIGSVTLVYRPVIYRHRANAASGSIVGHRGISRHPATAAPFLAVFLLERG
jgi:hypothetical protein